MSTPPVPVTIRSSTEQRGEGDGGARRGHEEGDEGQCQKRNALPEREAHDEGQLARKRLGMPGREERRQEPSAAS